MAVVIYSVCTTSGLYHLGFSTGTELKDESIKKEFIRLAHSTWYRWFYNDCPVKERLRNQKFFSSRDRIFQSFQWGLALGGFWGEELVVSVSWNPEEVGFNIGHNYITY